MVVFECPFCQTQLPTTDLRGAAPLNCAACGQSASPTLFSDTSVRRARDDDNEEGITPPENVKPSKKRSNDADDDDEGITPPENVKPSKKRSGADDEDDDDNGQPTKKKSSRGSSAAGAAAAGAGVGVGMILLIVGGITACCVCLPGAGVGVGVMALNRVREAAANTHAINNAKQIGLACHSYHENQKTLPSPRWNPQADLSWRVSVLPYLEQDRMFRQFNPTQPWDGPNNRPLTDKMPLVYAMQVSETSPQTKFQYFTGPNTLFPDANARPKIATITDGTSNTLLFAEAAASVPWAKAADMSIGAGALPLPDGKFIACMCDGHVRVVNRKSASDEVLRWTMHPSDGKWPPDRWGE